MSNFYVVDRKHRVIAKRRTHELAVRKCVDLFNAGIYSHVENEYDEILFEPVEPDYEV